VQGLLYPFDCSEVELLAGLTKIDWR